MMVKKVVGMGLALCMAASMAACGQTTAENSVPASQADSTSETAALNMEEILSQKPTGERIVLLSNNGGEGRDSWLLDRAKEAGFNIEFVSLGAGDITARVISEVNNPTANVVWGPSEDQFNSMIEAGALTEFTPDWADKVEGVSEVNGYSWSYEIQPKVLVCNPETYTADTVPTCYQDLWEKEEFHGKYAVPISANFGGNTVRAVIGGILGQYLDENGELGVSDEGWAAIKSYFDNGYKTPTGEDDFGNMASGKVPITFTFASGLKGKSESFGVTPIIAYSSTGEPSNTNQIGVVACDDRAVLEESIRLANWLGSADLIGPFAEEFGNIVANADAEEYMTPLAKEIKANFHPQEADWAYINLMMDEWIAKIQLEIY